MVVLVKSEDWLRELAGRGGEATAFPIAEGLYGVFARVDESGLAFLEVVEAPGERFEAAMAEVEARLDEPVLHGTGPWMLTAGGSFEASMLLLGFWAELKEDLELEELLVAAPSRELLLVGGGEHRELLEAMVAELYAHEPHYPLSQRLYRWTGSGWEALPEA